MSLLPRRLNAQLILLVSATLLASGALSGWATAQRQSGMLLSAMRGNAEVTIRNLSGSSAHYLVLHDYAGLEALLLKAAEMPDLRELQVCEADGLLIGDIVRAEGQAPVARAISTRIGTPHSPAISVEGENLIVWQQIEAGEVLGWVKAIFDMSHIRQAQMQTLANSLLLALAWSVGSAIMLLSVLRRTLGSLGNLAQFALHLDERKGARIEVGQGTREIADLAASLNLASERLYTTEQQLVRDITDRKMAEDQVRHLKNYLANIIDSMPSILVGLDGEGRVTQWNRQAEAATGIPVAEAIGIPVARALPEYTPWIEGLRGEIGRGKPATVEKLLLERRGQRFFYDLMLYPLMTNGVEGTVLRIEDVTERARIQELMIQTEKMMSVGGLAAGMAHEINNPLGIITQAAQNIERRVSPELPANRAAAEEAGVSLEAMQDYFERRRINDFIVAIREASSRASRIIANMLRFSRRAETARQFASLADLMEQAVELAANDYDLKKKYDFRSIEIVREYESGVIEVPLVVTEIEQVFLNLLKNAAQAMSANPPQRRPRIVLRLKRQEDYAVAEVEDNGPGMPEEVRRRVFEPFFTTKEPGVGTGLGLSVSYMIVTQNHHGLLEAVSPPGGGARFSVRLPLSREDAHV